jgi:hypothetical protein
MSESDGFNAQRKRLAKEMPPEMTIVIRNEVKKSKYRTAHLTCMTALEASPFEKYGLLTDREETSQRLVNGEFNGCLISIIFEWLVRFGVMLITST